MDMRQLILVSHAEVVLERIFNRVIVTPSGFYSIIMHRFIWTELLRRWVIERSITLKIRGVPVRTKVKLKIELVLSSTLLN